MIVETNYPLKNITTIGLGGYCKEYICPNNLIDFNYFYNKKNILYIGNGSNTCFLTDYYDGSIISLKRMKKYISHDKDYILCSGNISCNKFVRYLHNNKISGFEYLYGIPGTIGGSIFMNAGAYDEEILSHIHSIDLLDIEGKTFTLFQKDLNYSYRTSNLEKNLLVLSVKFSNYAKKFDKDLLQHLNTKRKTSQPTNKLSCGCIFKNPPNKFASQLIQNAGLKGMRVGGIYVSKKHSNYFINDGTGTHNDFIDLLIKVKNEILLKYNVELKEEVILVK